MEKAFLITFLVATSMVYNQALAQEEEISLSPEQYADVPAALAYDHELLHKMTIQRIRFLEDCTNKLSPKCGMEMTEGLVNDKPVSGECCEDILKIGIDCHQGLMTFVFSTYELKDVAYEILPRSKKIWNHCVQTTAARIGAPIAFET
ncbi:hypothetical protein EUTSA_v10012072mg [Eutrema salsugineum]|uniref:Prolamin-like domain-containing protein n=1 Tax=Eutrema salsugineum TaxID=72664 RepID=V4JXE4_EUTSA|nr:protein DOWN-REGULATED IN DIF1 11 [Eutrema salsugineum]ESQ30135.1 hypothetical protein EUTSA_v10012072mg [Eutrema salsugineum]